MMNTRGSLGSAERALVSFYADAIVKKNIEVAEFDIEKLLSFMWNSGTPPLLSWRYRPPFLLCLMSFFLCHRVKSLRQIEI